MPDLIDAIRHSAWTAEPPLPAHVARYPSMLTQEERAMLRWLTQHYYTGSGAICDLGSFLGGSTISLAEGLAAAGRPGKVIHSYDRHRAREEAWARWGLDGRVPYPKQGNFLPLMPTLLGPDLAARVSFHSGEFAEQPAPDGPIEILFIDLAKAKTTSDHVATAFLPKLIPGRSIVIQQDYFHPWPFFDIYTMEILADHFEVLGHAEKSAVFLTTKAIDATAAARVLSRDMTVPGMSAALESAARRWPAGPLRQKLEKIAASFARASVVPDTRRDFLRDVGQELTQEERAARRARRAQRRLAEVDQAG